ncbi:MAG: stage II sporulation protein M [Pseudomonadota bacterium]
MNINEFIRERKDDWEKLERTAAKLRRASGHKLSRDELWEIGKLYRGAVADLSTLRSSDRSEAVHEEVVGYLTGLIVRMHGVIYRKRTVGPAAIGRFMLKDFPDAVLEAAPFVLTAAAIFGIFGVVGFLLGLYDSGFIELLLPNRIIDRVESGEVWFDGLYAAAPLSSSRLMTHNVSVTFLLVALGITFGIGTLYLLALNGLLIGTAAALCHAHGLSLEFWSFVLPHGTLELTAVQLAGAAGLIIGHALIDPGRYKRSEYLAHRGPLAGKLAMGCVPLLIAAGIIEAFLSPSPLSAWAKLAVAAGICACLASVLFLRTGEDRVVSRSPMSSRR